MKEEITSCYTLIAEWLLDQNYFGLIITDNELRIIEINDWVLGRKKLKKQDVLNKNILDVFPEIKERKLDSFLNDALLGIHSLLSNKIHKYFIKVPVEGFSELDFEQHRTEISPLFKDDRIFGVLIRIEDVTERVIYELRIQKTIDELKKSNLIAKANLEKFILLAEHLPSLVIRFDRNLNIEYINQYITLITDIDAKEFLNKNISDIKLPEPIKNLFINNLKESLATKREIEIKFDYQDKNKNLKFLAVLIPEYDIKGEIQSILVVCRDITTEVEAIEKLEQYNRELEKLNLNKDKLFSIIAHDLRSPFNYLLNVVDVLDESFDELSSEEIKRYLKEFKLTTKNIYNLLENLLTWAQLQRGTIQLKITTFNLADFLKNNLIIFDKIASNKNISFELYINENTQISADPDLLNIVIRNLISNALKFTPTGGKVTIQDIDDKNYTILIVKDTGVGIDEEKLTNLFKIEKTKSEKGTAGEKGSGLGLILIKDIVEMHKGTIEVKSKKGEGTTVIVMLPKV